VVHISLVQPASHGEEGRDFRRLNLVTEPDVYPLPNMLGGGLNGILQDQPVEGVPTDPI
jgi:hypothetical protein